MKIQQNKIIKIIFLSLSFIISYQAKATITIQSVSGVSYSETDANGNITAYGGMAGTCAAGDMNNTSTCNSCIDTTVPAHACNMKSVYANLQITVSFVSDKNLTNPLFKITTDLPGTAGGEAPPYTTVMSPTSGAAGTVFTASIPWSYLCQNDNGISGQSCTPPSGTDAAFLNQGRKVYIYVDEDNSTGFNPDTEKKAFDIRLYYIQSGTGTTPAPTEQQPFCTQGSLSAKTEKGQCGYKLGVGDSKFYLENIWSGGNVIAHTSPPKFSSTSADWYGVALFAYDVANVDLIPNSAQPMEIRPYNSNFGLDDNTITGLNNYHNYCLLMGNVDKAQNIYLFNRTTSANPTETCAQPSEVIGMLSDKSCFISTAAFGSNMADQVQLLRKFRNQFLLSNQAGQLFVKSYYKYSPPLAHFIEHSEVLKAITRTFLYPFIAFAWLCLKFGIVQTLAFLFVVFGISYLFFKKKNAVQNG